MIVNTLYADEVTQFADGLTRITQACNIYLANQIPHNAELVMREVKELTEYFVTSSDENIKKIVDALNECTNTPLTFETEGAVVQQIRAITDIVEPNNLVLTYKQPL